MVLGVIRKIYTLLFDFIISTRKDDLIARFGTYFFMVFITLIFLHFISSVLVYMLVFIMGMSVPVIVQQIFFYAYMATPPNDFRIFILGPFFIIFLVFMAKLTVAGRNF